MDTGDENGGSAESVAAENNELEGRDSDSFVAVDLEVGIEGVQVGMLGTGAAPTSLQQKEVVAGSATLMREGLFEEGSNWSEADVDAANLNENLKIFIHKYAAIQYTSYIPSAAYKRSQSRDSSLIKVQFAGGEEENGTHAGVVQYYARAKLPGKSVVIISSWRKLEIIRAVWCCPPRSTRVRTPRKNMDC